MKENKITTHYISTENQLADIGTKHLNKHRLQHFFTWSRTFYIIDINILFMFVFSLCVSESIFVWLRFTISVNMYHRCMKILCRIERRHSICGFWDKYTVSYKHVNRRKRSTKRSRWISRGLTHHGFICLIEHIASAQFLFVFIFYKLLQLSLRGSVMECSY